MPQPAFRAMSATQELQALLAAPPPEALRSTGGSSGHHPTTAAHAALQYLRDTGDPTMLFLRCLLELQAPEELLFHCAAGARQVLVWRHARCSRRFRAAARAAFLGLAEHRFAASSRVCTVACLSAAAVLWKRAWEDEDAPENGGGDAALLPDDAALEAAVLEQLAAALSPPLLPPALAAPEELLQYLRGHWFQTQPALAAAFGSQLLGEFSGRSAVDYRLPVEFHRRVHARMEKRHLLPLLELALQALAEVLTALQSSDPVVVPPQGEAVVQFVLDVLAWESGHTAWGGGALGGGTALARTLLRPPVEWRDALARPELVAAVVAAHGRLEPHQAALALLLRQLLLQLASLSGPMFEQPQDKVRYAAGLLEGALQLMQSTRLLTEDDPLLVDALQIVSRILQNFRLATLTELQPTLVPLLQGLTTTGTRILQEQLRDCQKARGELDAMDFYDWREGAIDLIIDCGVTLCEDPWLLYTGTDETRHQARESLAQILGPLYEAFVGCRTRMAALEEHYHVTQEKELDDVKEEILETSLEEELTSISSLGRLNLSAALACLSTHFGETMPKLQSFWIGAGDVNAEIAALLEEARLLTMLACHLLTDDNKGENSAIPSAIVIACERYPNLISEIAGAVNALMEFANTQAHKIASDPANRRLSPMLSRSFLWFLRRWVPSYVYPSDCGESSHSNRALREWSTPEKAQQIVEFCDFLCLQYQCYWPQEKILQDSASKLLLSLAEKTGPVRRALVASPSFRQMVQFHCLTADMRHIVSHEEFDAAIKAKAGHEQLASLSMVWGYQRLPYDDKARILTVILIACSDASDDASNSMITESMKVVHDGFTSLVKTVSAQQLGPNDLHAKEMTQLCVEMFCGIARASEMWDAERIPQFVTPFLPQLTGLMVFYGKDLSVSEAVLRFFRDYTEHFIVMLNRDQCLALFAAAAEALKSYSQNHIQNRIIRRKSNSEATAYEEQAYSDILCALQLLVNLGTKDFIDACSADEGVESSQVTDMVFYGLQQVLPLMSEGLLQFPTLCTIFFELVFYMIDTYPDKVCSLPLDLFQALMESIMFGMKYHDAHVAKCSLHGLASIPKEYLKSPQILGPLLAQQPHIFNDCSRRLLTEVVFQNVVSDRVEPAGQALLYLAAVNLGAFGALAQDLVGQLPDAVQRVRLQAAFTRLIQPDMLAKAGEGGYEGRLVRSRFKQSFEEFVNDVQSFLLFR